MNVISTLRINNINNEKSEYEVLQLMMKMQDAHDALYLMAEKGGGGELLHVEKIRRRNGKIEFKVLNEWHGAEWGWIFSLSIP